MNPLDNLRKELHRVFESDRVNIDDVKALMSTYTSNREDWEKFAHFELNK